MSYLAPQTPAGGILNVVEDTTPQLGGDLDVNGQNIVSAAAGDITFTPDTTGDIILDGLKWPQADGTANYVLETNGAGQLGWVAQGGGGGVTNPMTANLDVGGFDIISAGGVASPDPITIQAGGATSGNTGGDIVITSGNSGYNGDPGDFTLTGGIGYGSAAGGNIDITGGYGGNAGTVTLEGGGATYGGTKAGDVHVYGGLAYGGSADGGDIILKAGEAAGANSTGAIVIPDQTAPDTTTNKLYSVAGALTWSGNVLETQAFTRGFVAGGTGTMTRKNAAGITMTCVRNGPGNYTCTFSSAQADADYNVQVTAAANVAAFVAWATPTVNAFNVHTFNSATSPTDFDFNVLVTIS